MELNRNLEDLLDVILAPGLLTLRRGSMDREVLRLAAPDLAEAGDLVFVWSREALASVTNLPKLAALVVSDSLFKEAEAQLVGEGPSLFTASNAELALVTLGEELLRQRDEENWQGIHPTAVVHPRAVIGAGCRISPGAVIGSNVVIGPQSIIGPHATIEAGAQIGQGCLIEAQAFIGRDCRLGNRVHIKPGAVIGSEGFGYMFDGKIYRRVPHLGIVILEDDVHVGANTTIDRGKVKPTLIRRGTKLDNLCHVAHNVEIGEDCVLAAQCGIAGTTKIGNRLRAGGQTGIYPHIEIGDDVGFGYRAAATKSIPSKGTYAGVPAQPLAQFLRGAAAMKRLSEVLRKKG